MKKVLIITYYWPPSGGAGVQRWLKLSKYLSKLGVEVHVLTVDEKYASFPIIDDSLAGDIEEGVLVHKTKAKNYFKLYESVVGKKNVPKAGYSNVDAQKFSQRLVSTVRSHMFIPDPRKGWNSYAVEEALKIINRFGISNVITTSPPHSTQLIGLSIQRKKSDINWIADFRDPWTDIYYYELLGHSRYSNKKDKMYEKLVLENSTIISTVSEGFKDIFLSKPEVSVKKEKIHVITNGFDKDDFECVDPEYSDKFIVGYTGTMSEQYSPEVFFESYGKLQEEFPNECELMIIGTLSPKISEYAKSIGVSYDYIPQVPHSQIVKYQKAANVLLLAIPEVKQSEGIIPGKLFEYLASQNPILVLGTKGGDVERIVENAAAGKVFSRSEGNEIYSFLKTKLEQFKKGNRSKLLNENILVFERSYQAKEFEKLLI